ncbi:hypothetical protein CANCADRAFT_22309 [Tortispora caseinolytica NRRL Y-17796]|uniref:DNL-type domain-containing protein n=1 Tax=Tortispora caseinolytica NRRL Y-17796 TaxID=767744 RepID=A0A1E4TI94_9ASCO|nr:hypothetical protein CANCADRAFT_22309 [Tortispora caseinolytica NRRL Y-17796]
MQPKYQLTMTCKPCSHRSSHEFSKQAYHHGTVLVKCPKCQNRHLIADHLGIFSDEPVTVEDILTGKSEKLRKGIQHAPEGDIEWLPE